MLFIFLNFIPLQKTMSGGNLVLRSGQMWHEQNPCLEVTTSQEYHGILAFTTCAYRKHVRNKQNLLARLALKGSVTGTIGSVMENVYFQRFLKMLLNLANQISPSVCVGLIIVGIRRLGIQQNQINF